MDEIVLRGMPFFAHHGVMPEETVTGQRFIVSTWLECDLREPGKQDDVSLTINYAQVYARVKAVVEGAPKKLIEAVAEAIATDLLAGFTRLLAVTVEIEKPGAPIPGIFDSVSVKIRRSR